MKLKLIPLFSIAILLMFTTQIKAYDESYIFTLPWKEGQTATISRNADAHELENGKPGQIDFLITTVNGKKYVTAAKGGTIIYANDTHSVENTIDDPETYDVDPDNATAYNNSIIIEHSEGWFSGYYHIAHNSIPSTIKDQCEMATLNVANCEVHVEAGQIIAEQGAVGYATASHLHFETGHSYVTYGGSDYRNETAAANDNVYTAAISSQETSGFLTTFGYEGPEIVRGWGSVPLQSVLHYDTQLPLTTPANNATVNSLTGFDVIVDNESVFTNEFTLQIDDNSDFSSPAVNLPVVGNVYNVKTLMSGKYYLRVKGKDTNFFHFNWSNPIEITVDNYSRDRRWMVDINADGNLDILLISSSNQILGSESDGNGNFTGFYNRGGTNVYPDNWFSDVVGNRLWAVDVNGDSRTDLLGVNYEGKIVVSFSHGYNYDKMVMGPYNQVDCSPVPCALSDDMSLINQGYWFKNQWHQRIWPVDFDKDGDMDILGINDFNEMVVWEYHKTGSYTGRFERERKIKDYAINAGYWFPKDKNPRMWLIDHNSDGDMDLLGISADGDVKLLESTASALRAANPTGSIDDTLIYTNAQTLKTGLLTSSQWQSAFRADIQPRLWAVKADSADNYIDFVYIDDNGDVLTATSNGSNYNNFVIKKADLIPDVNVNDWFTRIYHPRMWPIDANGDGRIDIVGLNTSTNGLRVALQDSSGNFGSLFAAEDQVFVQAKDWFNAMAPKKLWPVKVDSNGSVDILGVSNSNRIRFSLSSSLADYSCLKDGINHALDCQ